MSHFVIHRRSQHSAAEADDSASVVVFDLFMGIEGETQARHFVLSESPFDSDRLVGELGAGVSKEKLTLAKEGPVVIEPGAVGSRESGQSVSGDNTSTKVEMVDSGQVDVVADEDDSKIFELAGTKLKGRMRMNRDGDSKRFNIAFDGQRSGDGEGGGEGGDPDADVDPDSQDTDSNEDDTEDPKRTDVDDFVRPEFDEVLRSMIEDQVMSDDIVARLRAIRRRLADNEMSGRDVVFVLRLIAGGEDAARKADEEKDEVINLWDDSEWDDDSLVFLDSESGDKYKLQRDGNGTFTIPKFEFLREGEHNGIPFTKSKIRTIVQNFQRVSKSRYLDVPIKIGHHRNQSLKGDKGELAHGWVADAWEEGNGERAFARLERIPRALAFLLQKKALRNRSAEIFSDLEHDGKKIGPTLKAIALLGASTPAVRGLQPDAADPLGSLVQMYEEDGQHVIIANLRSEKSMPDNDTKDKKDKDQGEMITLSQEEFDKKVSEAANAAAEKTAAKLSEVHKKDTEELEAKLSNLGGLLGDEKAARRKEVIKAQREKNVLEFDSLVKDGHITPAVKDDFVALADILDGVTESAKGIELSDMLDGIEVDKDTMEFSIETVEDDKKVSLKVTPKSLLVRLLRGQKQVDFSTTSTDKKDETKDQLDTSNEKSKSEKVEELTRKVMKDQQLDYADALEIAVVEVMGDSVHEDLNVTGL